MRVIAHIATPWSPYAVTFSHDGTRLAIGGGAWYGFGGIGVIDLRSEEGEFVRVADFHDRAGSVSSLAFSADDRHLFASTWAASHQWGPTFAFEVDHLTLRRVAIHEHGGMTAITGVHPFGPGAITRTWNVVAEDTLDVHPWPTALSIDRTRGRPHLTSHRIVVVRDCAITGNHGAHNGAAPEPPLEPGLIMRSLTTGKRSYVHARGTTISAIGVMADDTIITGTMSGDLQAWQWHGQLPDHDRPIGTMPIPAVKTADVTWAVYQPTSVVAICSLAEGRVVAVNAAGTLATWQRERRVFDSWSLEIPGTPRAIAASPDRSLVAVGIKQGNAARPDATVALVELESEEVASAWRSPRVLEIAKATDLQRLPNGTFDPAMLGVLADALEEAGAASVLDHLRRHDRRLKTCWVVDGLR